MKKVFYLTTFLSLCCFYVGKSNTLSLKKVVNVTNPHLNLLNKFGYNSIIGQNILVGEKYKIEHELINSEGIVSNSQGKSLLSCNSVLIKSDKNNDDFSNNTPTITEAFYFLDINDTLGCIQGNCKNRYGTFIWSNGFKFVGYFKKRKPYDGDLYIFRGEKTIFRSIVAGIKIPFGRVDIKDIGTISGNFINGEIIKGKFKSSDGYNDYEGEFKDDKFNGQGSLTSKNGSKYVGGFKNGKYEGQGTLTSKNGDKYVGGFKDDKFYGQGSLTSKNGDRYVGEFKNDKYEGQGTSTSQNGDEYVGGFKDGKKSGQGTMIYFNGDKYVGGFLNDERNGQGSLTSKNGDKYVGEFKNGKYESQGTLTYQIGDRYLKNSYNFQISSNKCELEGKLFYSNCTKYFGDCQDNKANGWGELYLAKNNTLRGLFIDNKIQNLFIEYYFPAENKLIIGPNKGTTLNGPCISITNKYVSLANYENGSYRGNSDLFQIPLPNYNFNGIFCDADGFDVRSGNLIPNTNLVIYTSAREYNSRGDRKYWVTVVDLSSNRLIQKFGSYEKPLTVNDGPLFIGFTKENKPIYNYSNKYFQFEITSGSVTALNTLPLEIISKNNFEEKIRKSTYKDLGTLSDKDCYCKGLDKFIILKDSSYIKMFNSKIFLESVTNIRFETGSGSSLVMFNKNNVIIKSLDLPNYNIVDFDIDEKNERIALSFVSKDSLYLSYYDLKTFKLISNVTSSDARGYGGVKFSKSGTYLLYNLVSGTAVYLGNKLHYGIPGDIYDLNNDENVIIAYSGSNVYAYDLEKKSIIWNYPDSEMGRSFKIENKIYIINGRALSWEGFKVKENGIKLISFTMPKPLLSIPEFLKKPEETIAALNTEKDKNLLNKNNLSNKTESEIKKSDDDLFRSYLALLFLSAIFESSNNQ